MEKQFDVETENDSKAISACCIAKKYATYKMFEDIYLPSNINFSHVQAFFTI